MSELWPVVIVSLFLAAFSSVFSKYDNELDKYIKKDSFFYLIMAIVLIGFAGLRIKYNDTTTYIESYNFFVKSTRPVLKDFDWSLGVNPLFNVTMQTMKYLGLSSQSFLMIFAIITIGIYLWFIRKYTCNIWLSIFLFVAMGIYTFALAAIKQCIAVAFCLIAVDKALNKKWAFFIIWIIVAMLFHPYSVMYFIVPFMMFCPWTKKTYWSLLIFAFAGVSLQFLLGRIVDVTSMMGENYDVESFSSEGVNPFRLAVCAVPLVLSLLVKNKIFEQEDDKANNLFLNLSMLNAEIMFVALFGTANYFARLANYFLIFQVISLPWLFKFLDEKSRKIITSCAVICYLGYFYYSNIFAGWNTFDYLFDRITMSEYIKTLL